VQLGLENKKKMYWAIGLGAFAVLVLAYELVPMLIPSSTPSSSAEAAAPMAVPMRGTGRASTKTGKTQKLENLDPRLRLDLLAASENTQYDGTGRNIFVSQAEEVKIPTPVAPAVIEKQEAYQTPAPPPPAPIPLKFYGFASSPGEPKKIFLKNGDDVFVAGEGEIVDRRYKVLRITNTSVEIQDVVGSGPPQNIPLTQG
jgi:hypothetical protein